ncbi:MAG: right-handed parallel beta-helix repeat-containing protein [Phycisphaerales bacterium]|nr:right-handed parallel beta-helix repeat-containing protein [Phycisphaerales bacterium]
MRWCIAALALVLGCSAAAEVIRVPEDVLSVQHAIDRAKAGDTIDVAPGRYREAIDLRGKSIVVQGRDGPASTIIDATGRNESVVRCITAEGPGTVLVGLTFTGGTGHRGLRGADTALGGGLLAIGASPTIRDCVFLENRASHNGGGAYCGPAADVRFERCRFESNTAEKGGGMLCVSSRPVMVDCVFKSNNASYCGGGIFAAKASRPVLRGCAFITNRAAYQGGGACSLDSAGEILDSSFERNRAGSHGGAVYFGFRTSMMASGCIFKTATDSIDGVHQVARVDKRVGACTLGNGACVLAEGADCEAAGGTFRGEGTRCMAGGVQQARHGGDLDQDGRVDRRDLAILMLLWR